MDAAARSGWSGLTTRWKLVLATVGLVVVAAAVAVAILDDGADPDAPASQLVADEPRVGEAWSLCLTDRGGTEVLATPAEGAIDVTTEEGSFRSSEVTRVDAGAEFDFDATSQVLTTNIELDANDTLVVGSC